MVTLGGTVAIGRQVALSARQLMMKCALGSIGVIVNSRFTNYQLPITHYPLPITHYQLPITHSQIGDAMLQISSELAASNRIILMKDEVYRLPQTHREIQVLSGIAWITIDTQDIILNNSEKVTLPSSKNPAVISALNNVSLILAVW
jgi:hypothetical protein